MSISPVLLNKMAYNFHRSFYTIEYVPCYVSENHELKQTKNKLLRFLTGWQSSVPELYADFPETSYPSCTSKANNRKRLSKVRLVAVRFLPQRAQDTGWTRPSPRKCHEESEVWHCWCQIWHCLLKTRLYSLECSIPTKRGQIHHSGD